MEKEKERKERKKKEIRYAHFNLSHILKLNFIFTVDGIVLMTCQFVWDVHNVSSFLYLHTVYLHYIHAFAVFLE